MNNHQCYCYGIVAINEILKNNLPITSDRFFKELYFLWDIYSEAGIEEEYGRMIERGEIK